MSLKQQLQPLLGAWLELCFPDCDSCARRPQSALAATASIPAGLIVVVLELQNKHLGRRSSDPNQAGLPFQRWHLAELKHASILFPLFHELLSSNAHRGGMSNVHTALQFAKCIVPEVEQITRRQKHEKVPLPVRHDALRVVHVPLSPLRHPPRVEHIHSRVERR
jgi:hypothetical protein